MPNWLRTWWKADSDISAFLLRAAVWGFFLIALLGLYLRGFSGPVPVIEVAAVGILAAASSARWFMRKREQIRLLALTSKYLLANDESKLDDLLGALIAGQWEQLTTDPTAEFFEWIRGFCISADYETKRLVAEALPALYKINLELSKPIAEVLRHDWDEERWKGDNRRRTVESLEGIVRIAKPFVAEQARLMERDQIYTVIAIVELLDTWKRRISEKEGKVLSDSLLRDMRGGDFSNDDIAAISQYERLLGLTHSDLKAAIQQYQALRGTRNAVLQICLARTIIRLCPGYPGCKGQRWCIGSAERTLELMEYFLRDDLETNVRRPIAREQPLDCLVILLGSKPFSERAKSVIWKLINDSDSSIRVSTSDRIETMWRANQQFARQVIQHLLDTETSERILTRARHLQARLSGEQGPLTAATRPP